MNEDPHGDGSNGAQVVPISEAKAKAKAPALPAKRELHEKHIAQLTASGLNPDTVELARLYTEYEPRTIAALLRKRSWPRHHGSALIFPFYVPGEAEPYAYRLKPSFPRVEKRGSKNREIKYEQAAGSDVYVFFTPRARGGGWYADTSRAVYWTEGEKKALVLDQLGLTCVGLTGVYNWTDAAQRRETGEDQLHPLIRQHVPVGGRDHVIVFDADAKENPQVMTAAQRLAGVLLAAGARSVQFTCPPSKAHKGIDDFYAAFGGEITSALLAKPEPIEPIDPRSPLQFAKKLPALADAPVSDRLRIPDGYEVRRDGSLWKSGDAKHGDTFLAPSALLICRYLDDYYTNEARADVCYQRDGIWIPVCASRKALIDTRTMVAELGTVGAPVTCNTASRLVDWLEALSHANVGNIERVSCVSRTGWHTLDSARGFVLDKPMFGDEARERSIALDTRGDRKKLFASLEARGTFDAHLLALKRGWQAEPTCALIMCAALAAPLLEPLTAANFAVHLAGDSSKGKTSQLKIGASIFGDPNNDAWVQSWNTTMVGAEMRAATLNHLPQCYDEVGQTDAVMIERLVYMLVNGGGRARAQKDLSMRETASWRTVVISTGERELADESTATGAQVRVIQVPVTGFGGLGAAEIDDIREQCGLNAGNFGQAYVDMLLAIEDWPKWRETYREIVKDLRSSTVDGLQGRVAGFFGVLVLAEILASRLGLGEADGSTMRRMFLDTSRREEVVGLAERSLTLVRDWVLAEEDAFPELEMTSSGDSEPPKSKGPTRVRHGFRKGSALLLIGRSLRSFLAEHRLSIREVLREWKLRGWLQTDAGELTKVVRIGQQTPRFYVLDTSTPKPLAPEATQ